MTLFQKESILITGANGFIAKFLVEKLLSESDYQLFLLCRKKPTNFHISERIKYVFTDLNEKIAINQILEETKPILVIHLAALARLGEGERMPDKAFMTNVKASINLIEKAIKFGVQKFIFISSDLARPPVSVVGMTKFLTEAFIQNSLHNKTELITVRLPNVAYCPGSVHLIFEKQISENKSLTITHQKMTRRFVSGNEAANFIIFALKHGKNKDIFVVDKKPEEIISIAKRMIKNSGKIFEIETIGIRAGEKLDEESYITNELETISIKNLSLLKKKNYNTAEVEKVKQALQTKPFFTLQNEMDDL